MKKILLILAILGLTYCCEKKTPEPESSKVEILPGYHFKGMVNVNYDINRKAHISLNWSYPSSYTWANDILYLNPDKSITNYGGGTYSEIGDTTYINELNFPATTAWGFSVTTGYVVSANNVKLYHADTTINASTLSSIGASGKLFMISAYGLTPQPYTGLYPYQTRVFFFEYY